MHVLCIHVNMYLCFYTLFHRREQTAGQNRSTTATALVEATPGNCQQTHSTASGAQTCLVERECKDQKGKEVDDGFIPPVPEDFTKSLIMDDLTALDKQTVFSCQPSLHSELTDLPSSCGQQERTCSQDFSLDRHSPLPFAMSGIAQTSQPQCTETQQQVDPLDELFTMSEFSFSATEGSTSHCSHHEVASARPKGRCSPEMEHCSLQSTERRETRGADAYRQFTSTTPNDLPHSTEGFNTPTASQYFISLDSGTVDLKCINQPTSVLC